jgi:hypothetical protein
VETEVILTHYGWEASAIQGSLSAPPPDFIMVAAVCFSRFICDQMMVTA